MVYGARLESVLGSRPHEFESRILRQQSLGQWFKTLFVRTISTLPFFALSILLLSPLFGLSRSFNIAS